MMPGPFLITASERKLFAYDTWHFDPDTGKKRELVVLASDRAAARRVSAMWLGVPDEEIRVAAVKAREVDIAAVELDPAKVRATPITAVTHDAPHEVTPVGNGPNDQENNQGESDEG